MAMIPHTVPLVAYLLPFLLLTGLTALVVWKSGNLLDSWHKASKTWASESDFSV